METISFEQFKALDLHVGTIVQVDKVEKADKLLKLQIDLGQETRQILSGVAEFYPDINVLIGKQVVVLANLAPRVIRGYESQGMILMAEEAGKPILLLPETKVTSGASIN